MIEVFSKYVVSKRKEVFSLANGLVVPETAVISFLGESGEIISILELGVVDAEYLYRRISNNELVSLDKCFIEKFSMATFREIWKHKPNHFLNINGFIVTNSVIYSEGSLDFSFLRFSKGGIDFSNSLFLSDGLNFNHSEFGDGHFVFENATFHGGTTIFSNASFGEGSLSFRNAKFSRADRNIRVDELGGTPGSNGSRVILDFEAASFGSGKIDFTRSNLGSGDINFSNARFNSRNLLFVNANFNTVRFGFKAVNFHNGKLDFRFSNFRKGDLFFDRTVFEKAKVDFSATELRGGKISFNRAEFEKSELVFESSEFDKGKVVFKNNVFGVGILNFNSVQYHTSEVLFENVDFGKSTATFLKATIDRLALRSCHLNAYFDLQVRQCGALDLSNSIVRDIVDMKSYGFTTDIQALDLSGLHLLGHFYIDWRANKVKDLILEQQTSHRNRSEQFRILKENYHTLGLYDSEDEAYVEFRRSEAKANLEEALVNGKLLERWKAYALHGFRWLVFDRIGLYATSPARVLTSMVLVYLFFVLIYFLLPFAVDGEILPSLDHGKDISALGKAFYHSIITFLTIGYGDYYPMGIFRWISGFEGFIGLFLISYFTVAFVRKVLR